MQQLVRRPEFQPDGHSLLRSSGKLHQFECLGGNGQRKHGAHRRRWPDHHHGQPSGRYHLQRSDRCSAGPHRQQCGPIGFNRRSYRYWRNIRHHGWQCHIGRRITRYGKRRLLEHLAQSDLIRRNNGHGLWHTAFSNLSFWRAASSEAARMNCPACSPPMLMASWIK
jgi:hypothetical protein